MKYLNCISHGENGGRLLRIKKISDSGIYYNIYENYSFLSKNLLLNDELGISQSKRIDNSIGSIEINHGGFLSELIYEAALEVILQIETAFIINEDEYNWNVIYGSTNNETLFRITIPNNVYDKALMARDNSDNEFFMLWQVIDFCQKELPVTTSNLTYNAMVQYLEEILPEHLSIIESYIKYGVSIEQKSINK